MKIVKKLLLLIMLLVLFETNVYAKEITADYNVHVDINEEYWNIYTKDSFDVNNPDEYQEYIDFINNNFAVKSVIYFEDDVIVFDLASTTINQEINYSSEDKYFEDLTKLYTDSIEKAGATVNNKSIKEYNNNKYVAIDFETSNEFKRTYITFSNKKLYVFRFSKYFEFDNTDQEYIDELMNTVTYVYKPNNVIEKKEIYDNPIIYGLICGAIAAVGGIIGLFIKKKINKKKQNNGNMEMNNLQNGNIQNANNNNNQNYVNPNNPSMSDFGYHNNNENFINPDPVNNMQNVNNLNNLSNVNEIPSMNNNQGFISQPNEFINPNPVNNMPNLNNQNNINEIPNMNNNQGLINQPNGFINPNPVNNMQNLNNSNNQNNQFNNNNNIFQ